MKSEYELIFEQRGRDYDLAMQRYPNARDNEFLRLFDHVDLDHISSLADIPSGGGYLDKFLPETCEIDAIEPCGEFQPKDVHTTDAGLDHIVLPAEKYDAVVCLAAIHHVKEKPLFINNLYRGVKKGGYLLLGDVLATNPITEFLDNFAGNHNGTGHNGMYLDENTVASIVSDTDASIINVEEIPCPWVFDKKDDMLDFCRLLFGLKNVDDDALADALEQYVSYDCGETYCTLNWALLYHTIQKPA